MAKNAPSSQTQAPAARRQPARQAITLEVVRALTPSETRAEQMSTTFGLDPVDVAAIREGTEEHVVRIGNELRDNLNDKALAIFLQRIVSAFVSGAHGAAVRNVSTTLIQLVSEFKLANLANFGFECRR